MLMFHTIVKVLFYLLLVAFGVYLGTQVTIQGTLAYEASACDHIESVHEQTTVFDNGVCYFVSNDLTLEPVPTL